ncbi:MAG TPA: tetratricopeptide repeat-containing protein [Thermoanaerobaculia bacterium]|nr:tetratricopeptide repeat-containing protein [Thermoanaerobaculia bacterium]
MADEKGTCFVVMGFGKKTDFETGRTLDLDKSYRNVIKPAIEAVGFACIRADEIVHSGLIDVPMYEQLLAADIVVADLSTSNKNAFYELGIRHALRPYTTIVIAEEGLKVPFDVNHVVVRHYKHLGEDIGFDEVMRFRGLLSDAVVKIAAEAPDKRVDSPVYRFLNDLGPPLRRAVGAAAAAAAAAVPAAAQPVAPAAAAPEATHSVLMQQVDEAVKRGDFTTAKTLLAAVRAMILAAAPPVEEGSPKRREDPYLIQRLALLTYKSKQPTEQAALAEAKELLAGLDPQTSNDTETLGLWGAIHKRLWTLTASTADLDEAVRAHERGFYLRNDYYNGINLAFLLNVRAARATDPAEAIADFVLARRVRTEVLEICEKWLASNPPPPAEAPPEALKEDAANRYWVLATAGEAKLGLGDGDAERQLATAYAAAPQGWMADSTREQIAKLQALLADPPLRHLKPVA